jgi:Spy/CpxP family protein refolding chaperone
MKLTKTMLVAALVAGSLFAGDTALFAQPGGGGGGGGGGGRGGRGGILTPEQNTQIRDAVQASAELTALNTKLAAAQKEAVDAALAPDATDKTIRAKVEAVAKIQTDIAVLRYSTAVKQVVPSITAEQKTQMDAAPAGATYGQLFGGGMFGGGRGGRGGPGGGAGGGAPPAPAN